VGCVDGTGGLYSILFSCSVGGVLYLVDRCFVVPYDYCWR